MHVPSWQINTSLPVLIILLRENSIGFPSCSLWHPGKSYCFTKSRWFAFIRSSRTTSATVHSRGWAALLTREELWSVFQGISCGCRGIIWMFRGGTTKGNKMQCACPRGEVIQGRRCYCCGSLKLVGLCKGCMEQWNGKRTGTFMLRLTRWIMKWNVLLRHVSICDGRTDDDALCSGAKNEIA